MGTRKMEKFMADEALRTACDRFGEAVIAAAGRSGYRTDRVVATVRLAPYENTVFLEISLNPEVVG